MRQIKPDEIPPFTPMIQTTYRQSPVYHPVYNPVSLLLLFSRRLSSPRQGLPIRPRLYIHVMTKLKKRLYDAAS